MRQFQITFRNEKGELVFWVGYAEAHDSARAVACRESKLSNRYIESIHFTQLDKDSKKYTQIINKIKNWSNDLYVDAMAIAKYKHDIRNPSACLIAIEGWPDGARE